MDVIWTKIFEGIEYKSHIEEISRVANNFNAHVICDGGPDPMRGHLLMDMTSAQRCQLVRYENGKLIQRFD